MKNTNRNVSLTALAILAAAAVLTPHTAQAHCDGLDGPVVKAAQKALADGKVNLVLIWVQKEDEIKRAFEKTLVVRKLNVEAKELADMYFFETLVRIHRTGEGAPYTGLKPAGRDLGPAIPAADKALETGSIEPVVKLLSEKMEHGLHTHFNEALAKKKFDKNDVEAGRAFVKAYVEYIHYVEGLHEAAASAAHGHFPEAVGITARKLYVADRTYEVTGEGYGPQGEVRFEGKASDARHAGPLLELATVLIGCNNAHLVLEGGIWKVIGDPTEGALLAVGRKAGASGERIEKDLPKHHEIPFKSFSFRSERKPVWRIPILTNLNLGAVVVVSFGLQIWSLHSEALGRVLKTSMVPFSDCLMLLAASAIPLTVLEVVKCVRNGRPNAARQIRRRRSSIIV